MGIPSGGIGGGNRRDGQAHGLLERFLRASAQAAQDRLELGERLLNRVEVRRVGRQEAHVATACGERRADTGRFMGAEIVHHDDLPRMQVCARCSRMYHSKVSVFIARFDEQPGVLQPVWGERRHQRRVRAVVARGRGGDPDARW